MVLYRDHIGGTVLGTSAVLDPHPREIHGGMGQGGVVGIVGDFEWSGCGSCFVLSW